MKWKNVFNTWHKALQWGTIDKCAQFVGTQTGYKFFDWNGSVYFIEVEGQSVKYHDTGITVDEVE